MQPERLCQRKIPMTPWGIEPTTYCLVAQDAENIRSVIIRAPGSSQGSNSNLQPNPAHQSVGMSFSQGILSVLNAGQ